VARVESQPESRDEGVILVFWVLCLSLLAALFVGVITLGNLLQSADNAQNAADAAALAGAGTLQQQPYSVVLPAIPLSWNDRCRLLKSGAWQCSDFTWLYGPQPHYFVYEHEDWLLIVNNATSPFSQASAKTVFQQFTQSGAWTCSAWVTISKKQFQQHFCVEFTIHPPGPTGVDGSLTDYWGIGAAQSATQAAISIQKNYGFTSYSGCNAPPDFLLADRLTGVSCIAYDAAGTIWVSVPDPAVIPGSGPSTVYRTSWATILASGTAALCSGMPPTGTCN
jgi:hypothetical protein